MSVDFDGSNDYISYSGVPQNSPPLIFECWFKFDGWAGGGQTYQRLIDSSGSTSHAILRIERDGDAIPVTYRLQFSAYTIFGGTSVAECTTNLSTGTWYHGLGYWSTSGNVIGCLVNGANLATNTRTGTVLAFTTHTIGASSAGAEKYDGKLAEVVIWNMNTTTGSGGKHIYTGATGLLPLYRPPYTYTNATLRSWLRLFSASDFDLANKGYTLTWNGPPAEDEDHPPVFHEQFPVSWPRATPAAVAVMRPPGPGVFMWPGMVA
jgi:hypothetical protein